jgi:hypothetical protein
MKAGAECSRWPLPTGRILALPAPGRGAVAVLDVADNDVLHRILTEWADIVPAAFDVTPLIDRAAVAVALKRSAKGPTRDQALWAPIRNRTRAGRSSSHRTQAKVIS